MDSTGEAEPKIDTEKVKALVSLCKLMGSHGAAELTHFKKANDKVSLKSVSNCRFLNGV